MNKSIYTRPDKPRRMIVPERGEVPDPESLIVAEPLRVSASTECFTTPGPVVELMIDYADIEDGHSILEPSAGTGAIAGSLVAKFPASKVDVFEVDYTLRNFLKEKGYNLAGSDFLEFDAKPEYNRILMNPPFRKLADIDHVRKAFDCLKPGGRLVAITSPGPFFHSQKKAVLFREWFDGLGGEVQDLPEESFKNSGTSVNSKILILNKGEL